MTDAKSKGLSFRKSPGGIYHGLKIGKRAKLVITRDEFCNWYVKQPKVCEYCGIPEELLSVNKLFAVKPNVKRLTIDRIDNDRPYELGNLALACLRCNQIKSDFFSAHEMKLFGEFFMEDKWRKNV